MQYKGHELEEITNTENIVLPKKMVLWDNIGLGSNDPCVRKVLAIVKDNVGITRVIASQLDNEDAGVAIWNHCTEIPEEPKPRRATNRELAKWLAQGNGQCEHHTCDNDRGVPNTYWEYISSDDYEDFRGLYVRKWDDTEWHEPTVDYMGLEA